MSVANNRPAADMLDQAAGLRRWAEQNRLDQAVPPAKTDIGPDRTLMLFSARYMPGQAYATLQRWHQQGHKWIGHPDRWNVRPVDNTVEDLQVLARQQPRWGIWIDSEPDALRRALQSLRDLHERGGPLNLLVLHSGRCRQDRLINLRDVAQRHLGIRLLLIDEALSAPDIDALPGIPPRE
jgi:hypothetical protein